jgi:hypothetical protein
MKINDTRGKLVSAYAKIKRDRAMAILSLDLLIHFSKSTVLSDSNRAGVLQSTKLDRKA